jgi:Tfp pilus assembly protein PilV
MRRGFLLIEASTATLVLSLALVTLIPVFILALRSARQMEQITAGTQLSSQLMEEVCLRKWDTATPRPPIYIAGKTALGTDQGETASDKRTFDDVDDFNGWTESPPRDPMMNPMPDFAAYTRSVTVKYVNADLSAASGLTDYKYVSVCTSSRKLKPICMEIILTNR